MLYDLRCCGFVRQVLLRRRGEAPAARNVKRGGELVWVDMLMVDVNVTHIYIYDVYFKLRYRVEMAIADDTAEGTFVWFDGVMTKLHNLRASEAVQMLAEDGVNPDDSRIPPFIADMEGKSYTFQKETTILIFSIVDELGRVRDDDVDDNGGNEDDDDNMPNGKPAPVGFASGRATGNGSDGSIRYCA
ncbi:BnaCnng18780D [Brassica napus]|uniref:BnaCnng18780D protein n=1 Tax=Brassica napus TaxID=3708 RepID=A0A078IL91_BRANA|nr:BnaCnng18780D [Brassica napus]